MAAILNFGGHYGSYINYYQSETFLMPSKTFCRYFHWFIARNCFMSMLRKIFLNQIAAISELAAIATLKRKLRDGNTSGITEYI